MEFVNNGTDLINFLLCFLILGFVALAIYFFLSATKETVNVEPDIPKEEIIAVVCSSNTDFINFLADKHPNVFFKSDINSYKFLNFKYVKIMTTEQAKGLAIEYVVQTDLAHENPNFQEVYMYCLQRSMKPGENMLNYKEGSAGILGRHWSNNEDSLQS